MSAEASRIVKIVNAVKKHECLWNVNSNDYNKRDKLEKAWSIVSQEVGKSEVFCRDKWRNVRTGFLRSVQHQIRKSDDEDVPSDFHTVKRKRFYLYDQMSFLLPAAECLEVARKKRRQSRDRKVVGESEDGSCNDNDYCDNTNFAYSIVGKFEQTEDYHDDHDNDLTNEYAEEHHTLQGNHDDNDKDEGANGNNDDMEQDNCKSIGQKLRCANVRLQNDKTEEQNVNDHSPTTRKIMNIIDDQLHEETNARQVVNNNRTSPPPSSPVAVIRPNNSSFHERDEEQLLYFFRGCIDDILTLDKRKQRLFKRRMLDLIDELHDS